MAEIRAQATDCSLELSRARESSDPEQGAAGGDSLYAALGARWWGVDVAIVSRVGEDYPEAHVDRMRGAGIDVRGIRFMPGPTIHYRVTYHGDDERVFEHLTEAARLDELSPAGAELDRMDGSHWVHVAAMPIDRQAEAVTRARAVGVPYSLDPHDEYITEYEAELTDLINGSVFLPSELEASLAFPGLRVEDAAERFIALGANVAAVKRGAAGSIVHAEGKTWTVPPLAVPVVDPTGAGDAYCGGFVAGLLNSGSAFAAACCGTASAAHIIQGFGAFGSAPPSRSWMDESLAMLLEASVSGEGLHTPPPGR